MDKWITSRIIYKWLYNHQREDVTSHNSHGQSQSISERITAFTYNTRLVEDGMPLSRICLHIHNHRHLIQTPVPFLPLKV